MEIFASVAVTFLVTMLLALLYFNGEKKKYRRNYEQSLNTFKQGVMQEHSQSERILQTMDLGVIFFNSSGQASSYNKAAVELLRTTPSNFHVFLDTYGQENGMSAQIALGKTRAHALIPIENSMIYLTVQVIGERPNLAHVVMIRDATIQFNEEQERKKYVSNVSHELRTPLTTIKSYSETLVDWGVMEKQREQILKDVRKIYEEAERMEQLIDDLGLLSSLDESSIDRYLHVESVDLNLFVKDLVERMQGQAAAKKIILRATSVKQALYIYCDHNQLERIVANLITNALKYSEENSRVDVFIGSVRDEIYVKVKDNGIGIDPKDHAKIFQRFYRVDDSRTRKSGGRGLGLAIVKELVELHEGTISLESQIDLGSEFTIMFPSRKKVLCQCLYELKQDGVAAGHITSAAQGELEELAPHLGIMAEWSSLQAEEYKILLQAINDLA